MPRELDSILWLYLNFPEGNFNQDTHERQEIIPNHEEGSCHAMQCIEEAQRE